MTDDEKLLRDIDTLIESIRLDWQDLSKLDLNPVNRNGIRNHIDWCIRELNDLKKRLDEFDAQRT